MRNLKSFNKKQIVRWVLLAFFGWLAFLPKQVKKPMYANVNSSHMFLNKREFRNSQSKASCYYHIMQTYFLLQSLF